MWGSPRSLHGHCRRDHQVGTVLKAVHRWVRRELARDLDATLAALQYLRFRRYALWGTDALRDWGHIYEATRVRQLSTRQTLQVLPCHWELTTHQASVMRAYARYSGDAWTARNRRCRVCGEAWKLLRATNTIMRMVGPRPIPCETTAMFTTSQDAPLNAMEQLLGFGATVEQRLGALEVYKALSQLAISPNLPLDTRLYSWNDRYDSFENF